MAKFAVRFLLVLLTAMVVAIPVSSATGGQLSRIGPNGERSWFFSGATWSAVGGNPVDPVNYVFFSPYQRYGENEVAGWVTDQMKDYDDNILASNQWMYYTTARGRGSNHRWNDTDKEVATARALVNRKHVRMWGDDPLAEMLDRQAGKWVVGSAHQDTVSCVRKTFGVCSKWDHKVHKDWDTSRREFASDMRNGDEGGGCTLTRWKRHPGAVGWFGDPSNDDWYHHSSGIMARITLVDRGNGCRKF